MRNILLLVFFLVASTKTTWLENQIQKTEPLQHIRNALSLQKGEILLNPILFYVTEFPNSYNFLREEKSQVGWGYHVYDTIKNSVTRLVWVDMNGKLKQKTALKGKDLLLKSLEKTQKNIQEVFYSVNTDLLWWQGCDTIYVIPIFSKGLRGIREGEIYTLTDYVDIFIDPKNYMDPVALQSIKGF